MSTHDTLIYIPYTIVQLWHFQLRERFGLMITSPHGQMATYGHYKVGFSPVIWLAVDEPVLVYVHLQWACGWPSNLIFLVFDVE